MKFETDNGKRLFSLRHSRRYDRAITGFKKRDRIPRLGSPTEAGLARQTWVGKELNFVRAIVKYTLYRDDFEKKKKDGI